MPVYPALTETIVAGVTTGHISDTLATQKKYNADRFGNVVNVMHSDYGAIDGGSAATNTAALNDARADIVATGDEGAIYIPAGVNLPVTPDAVLAGSNVRYFGGGTLSTTQTTAGALITFPAGSTNSAVDGLTFSSPNDAIVAVSIKSAASVMSSDIAICNNRCIESRLVVTNDETITYASHSTHVTSGTVTRNVTITGNRCKRSAANTTTKACILLWFTVGGIVTGNRINGYPYGIQWWGGDADPALDGAIASERKCGQFVINDNYVLNILDSAAAGAGIWGSMGKDITVAGNVVLNCADVGLDCEGGDTVTFSGNTVTNCPNGCLTAFFYNTNVRFTGNVCRQDTAGTVMARIQNNYPTSENRDITLDANTFTCPPGIARIALETAQRAILRNNTLRNVRVDGETNNIRNTTIKNNDMMFDVVAGAAFNAVNVGKNHLGGRAIIVGNTIESTVTQPGGSRGIRTYQDDPTRDVLEFIDDNILLGWSAAIETIWDGANAGFTARTFIRRNTIDVGATITTTRGAASTATGIAATIVKEDNRYANGVAVP